MSRIPMFSSFSSKAKPEVAPTSSIPVTRHNYGPKFENSKMSGWSGFTEEQLQRMREDIEPPPQENKDSPINEPIKVAKLGQQKKKTTIPKWGDATGLKQPTAMKPRQPQTEQKKIVEDQKEKAVLAMPSEEEKKKEAVNKEEKSSAEIKTEASNDSEKKDNSAEASKASQENGEAKVVDIGVLTEAEQQELKLSSLVEMQMKQKLIEEENKKRQKLIQQTLQEKFKQTQSESQKLKDIHRELKLVDSTFQADIDGLRCRIDEACVAFSNAQKRYEKSEKEYVNAKLDYFQKKDLKDELTEQLYAIIQDNEVKKAKKLEELMSKLSTDSENSSASATPISMSPPPPLQDQVRAVAT